MKLKNGAMFGLCRALRKQSGRLFLVSRHSEASKGANGSFKTNRAAMFGLDARIALAIFGTLSIIAGAALYLAIQKADSVKYQQIFVEMIKASEQYYFDNGEYLQRNTSYQHYVKVPSLYSNVYSLPHWKGPYLQNGTAISANAVITPLTRALSNSANKLYWISFIMPISEWSTSTNITYCVIDDSDCAEYMVLRANSASVSLKLREIFKGLDALVDGSDGYKAGKVRMVTKNNQDFIAYMGQPRIRKK